MSQSSSRIEPLEPRQLLASVPIDPANFVRDIDNPFMPLTPGTTFIYREVVDGKASRNIVTVTHQTKQILGVTATVVHDRGFSGRKLAEDTFDWYAQDKAGNVWYFGEDTKELNKNGKVVGTEGSWEAGVNGARPGIAMEAHPKVGDRYRQEFAADVAEDRGQVLALNQTVEVPFGTFNHALKTKDFSLLEPGVVEHKFYVGGIGFVASVMVKGGKETSRLVAIRH